MNKVKHRTLIIVAVAAALLVMIMIFLIKYENKGEDWAIYPFNAHAFHDGIFVSGQVVDSDNTVLLDTKDGHRVYNDDYTLRRATLHVVGDANGNIGGSAQRSFRRQLAGYNMFNGLFSINDKGRKLWLTVDSELNRVAYQALDGRNGCVAVYDYVNGQLLCLVSTPGFDPADPPASIDNGAYINRVLSASYTPGSIYKVITLAAALEQIGDVEQRSFSCSGSWEWEGGRITCPKVHGEQDIASAFANSCNIAFGQLGLELGAAKLNDYSEQLGLLEALDISGFTTVAGSFEQAEAGTENLAWSAIGQHKDLVCPAAMLRLMGAIANEGKGTEPRLIKKVTNSWGLPTALPELPQRERLLSTSTAEQLKQLMLNNITENYGADNFPGLAIGAKSGTAEVGSSAPHAWFVGFLDDTQHPLAFVVLVENGGSGSSVAGSIANKVLQEAIK